MYIVPMQTGESIHSAIEPVRFGNGLPADQALIGIRAPEPVLATISRMERTEEATFSPSGRRLAIGGFGLNRIYLYALEVNERAGGQIGGKAVNIPACVTIHSSVLQGPHGIAFIDEAHMMVANRGGGVHVFHIPPDALDHDEIRLQPVRSLRSSLRAKVRFPGSIECLYLGNGRFRALVCNNYLHTITAHTGRLPDTTTHPSGGLKRIRNDGVFLEKGLSVPDGICASPDQRWLAVSVHTSGNLHLYRLDRDLNRNSLPDVVLEGVVCPHGLQFSADGKVLYAADSASPYLHIFYRRGDGWVSLPKPDKSIRILNEQQFELGRYNAEEGGLKGIDVLHDQNILATTCEFHPLAFYDLDQLQHLGGADADDEIRQMAELRNQAMRAIGWQ